MAICSCRQHKMKIDRSSNLFQSPEINLEMVLGKWVVSGYRQREKIVKSGVIGETVVGTKMSLFLACTRTIFRVIKMRHLHWATNMLPKD